MNGAVYFKRAHDPFDSLALKPNCCPVRVPIRRAALTMPQGHIVLEARLSAGQRVLNADGTALRFLGLGPKILLELYVEAQLWRVSS